MPSFARPWNLSRERSFDRLRQEAQFAGADAVIGIEMTAKAFLGDPGQVEYIVFGTAMRETTLAPRRGSGPRMCALSGQDVDKLRRIGAETLGVIGHTSVVLVALSPRPISRCAPGGATRRWSRSPRRVYAARQLAMDEVRRQAIDVGANDMVISTLTHSIDHHEYERRRVCAAFLHRLDARAGHRDCPRRTRASPGPVGRARDVDQSRRIARRHSRRTSDVDIRPDEHRRPRRTRQRALADECAWPVHV